MSEPVHSHAGQELERIRFVVHGVAAPQGSKRFVGFAGGRGRMLESSKRVAPWRAQVANQAGELMAGAELMAGPLSLRLDFYLPRPRGHHGTGRNAGAIRASAPQYPATIPDLSKLVRAVEDALTGVVWRDDAQLVAIDARKWYADREAPRTVIDARAEFVETHGEWVAALKGET